MGRIQSTVGLVTGIPIQDTVDQLLKIAARPRDLTVSRNAALKQQQIAVLDLTALVVGVELAAKNLGKAELFTKTTSTSSNTSLISAAVTGTPAVGTHQITPVQKAQSQQLVSGGFASPQALLGQGEFTFRFGGYLDEAVDLARLNGGQGVQRGKIRITDRSGASAVIDLRFARTVDDVLRAINDNETVNVVASTVGDSLRLVDQTGQSTANLRVQEVSGGTTAADLGLATIDAAASSATGADVLRLHAGQSLSQLRGGNGLALRDQLPDLKVTFRDGSADLSIDLSGAATLGDVLTNINQADPARLKAEIAPGGDRLVFTDLTTDTGGTFTVASPLGGELAEQLGLTGTAVDGAITGARLQGGLRSPLLSNLGGHSGLGALGIVDLTDRLGATASVDLSSAETLDEVIGLLNASGTGIQAQINKARDGIVLTDTTSGTASNLIVANGDATNTADKLGIAIDAASAAVDSRSLGFQAVTRATRLDSYDGGKGVKPGQFTITDTQGTAGVIDLAASEITTVGQLLDAVNALPIGVLARLNDKGDGIVLVDTAGGSGPIKVRDVGDGKAAADLRLAGDSVEVDIGGTPTKVIDGRTTHRVEVTAEDTLATLVEKINALGAGVRGGTFNEGSGASPFRLSLTSERSGQAGGLRLDAADLGFSFQEITAARDAVVLLGSASSPGAGILAASSQNKFDTVIDGVSLTVNGTSTDPVAITVAASENSLIGAVQLLVDAYNKLRDKLDSLTFRNEADNSIGVLFASNEALRVDSDFSQLLSGAFAGVGSIRSLGELGVSLDGNGKLSFDVTRFREKSAADPAAIREFFTKETFGFSAKAVAVATAVAGAGNSLLLSRNEALQAKIDLNDERIAFFNARLDRERERLLKQFFDLESAIGKLQAGLTAIQNLQIIEPLSFIRK
jgi:flagellar hook-associated protein 2